MIEPTMRVRTRCRQSEPPRAKIPEDGRDQQRENHGEARAGTDLQNQFDRQQRDDGERHGAGEKAARPARLHIPDHTTAMFGSSECV